MSEPIVKRIEEALVYGTTGRDALPNLLWACKAAIERHQQALELIANAPENNWHSRKWMRETATKALAE